MASYSFANSNKQEPGQTKELFLMLSGNYGFPENSVSCGRPDYALAHLLRLCQPIYASSVITIFSNGSSKATQSDAISLASHDLMTAFATGHFHFHQQFSDSPCWPGFQLRSSVHTLHTSVVQKSIPTYHFQHTHNGQARFQRSEQG